MKKKFLVLLRSPERFDANNYFLGRWCVPFNYENKNTIKKCLEYHWNNKIKREKDAKYLNNFYEKVLEKLSIKLNKIHKINFSKKEWRLILGFWLTSFITKCFDSYENLNFFLKENKRKFSINFFLINSNNIIPKDYSDYTINYINNFFFNQYIYQDLITKHFNNKFIIKEKKIIKNNFGTLNINSFSKNNFLILLIKKFLGKFSFLQKNIFFEFSYINPLFKKKLMWMLNIMPNYNFPFYDFKKKEILKNVRQLNLGISSKLKFENFIDQNILKYVPYSYLENFRNIYNDALKLNLNSTKIFSTGSYIANDFFKIWLANRLKKKAKFYIMYHGGGIPVKNHLSNHDEKVSHKVITWHKPINNKQIQLLNLSLKNEFISRKKIYILITLEPGYFYPVRFFSGGPVSSQFLIDYEEKKIFAKKVIEQGQKIKIRPLSSNEWDLKNRISKDLGANCYDNIAKFRDSLKNTKLHISGCFSTTFSESITMNIPSIGFFDKKKQNYNNRFNYLIKLFYENSLLFHNTKNLMQFLKKNEFNLDEWWNSKKIQKIIDIYQKDILSTKNKSFNKWKKLINK